MTTPADPSAPGEGNPLLVQIRYQIIHRAELFRNIHAGREFKTHTVSFERGDPIVDDAVAGDRYVVIACAQYPAWACEVAFVEIDVYTGI